MPCVATLCASPVLAQEKPGTTQASNAAAAKDAGDDAQVVTVTATRRREPLRDVPLRVEILSTEQLANAGAASVSDYIGSMPGVDVKTDGGAGRSQISIRGVSTGDQTIATVGVYIDDVAFGSSSAFVGGASTALDMALLDLNHIELLRGPQGTLYGAGAMGGLLKYVTNEPDTGEFSGSVSLGASSISQGGVGHTVSTVVNVPLRQDVAGLRLAAFDEYDGGYVKAIGVAPGNNVNSGRTQGARASLLVEPSAHWKVRLTATGQDIHRKGLNYVEYNAATGRPLVGDLTKQTDIAEPYNLKVQLLSADIEYDFGWARLNLIGSSQHSNEITGQDVTRVIPIDGFSPIGLTNTVKLAKETEELRLTSAPGTVEWIAGLYHDKESGHFDQLLYGTLESDGSLNDLITITQPSRYKETAAYGDLTWNFAHGWSLTGGARWASNKQVYTATQDGAVQSTTPANDTSKTYLATIRYSLTTTSSVYARAASGYRPGGPNPPAIDQDGHVVAGSPTSFKPDSLWSYEAGYKADLLDKRLSVEAALYDIRWTDLQQPVPIGATTVITNAGKAEIRGLELSSHFRATKQWTLDGNFGYIDAKLTQDSATLGPAGTRLANSAKFAGTVGTTFNFGLAGHSSYASLDARHVGQRNAGFDAPDTALPPANLPAYTLFDAQAGTTFGKWQFGTYVRNITNRRALLSADTALTAFGGPLRAVVVQPRTIGATATVAF